MTERAKSTMQFAVLFAIGFVIATATIARADGSHYETSDWSANPRVYGDSTMPAPFSATSWEDAVYAADDPWDAVSGAWVNIAVIDTIPLGENLAVEDVPIGDVYVVAYAGGGSGPYATTGKDYNYVISQIQRARVRMNKDIGHWVYTNSLTQFKMDYLTILIHEFGHVMGVTHRTFAMEGTADGYGTCPQSPTSNLTTWNNQATMCEVGMTWGGAGTVTAAGRTLHSHEVTDYANNY